MSLHNGSSRMAHNLDRFAFNSDFEDIAGEAARLNVSAQTIRMYWDWYGAEEVAVMTRAGMKSMPAYEYEIRWQIHGEKVERYRQLELAFPAPTNHYAYERRGW
jgi:hypothetical protein